MKKIILLLALLISTITLAQENEKTYPQDTDKKHEFKINAFNLIVIPAIDVSYEQLINQNSSFGVAIFMNVDNNNNDIEFPRQFSLTPYYRYFFSETKFARGFFVEGFGSLNTVKNNIYYSNNSDEEKLTSFALGLSVGSKFVTKRGFTVEVFLGVGRNLIREESKDEYIDNNIVGRFGASIGYRF